MDGQMVNEQMVEWTIGWIKMNGKTDKQVNRWMYKHPISKLSEYSLK